jgi:hypothetical protein
MSQKLLEHIFNSQGGKQCKIFFDGFLIMYLLLLSI